MIRAAGFLLLIATSAFAQVKETIEVSLIEVPVTVSDAKGNPVRGLTANDFKILDNGQPRAITSFDVIDLGSQQAPGALASMNPIARRSFLLLFDLGHASPNSIARAQNAARIFVKTALQPADVVSVATIDTDGQYKRLTSFTSDRELIAAAIDNPARFRAFDPLGISSQSAAVTAEFAAPGMATDVPGVATIVGTHEGKRGFAQRNEQEAARAANYMNERVERQRVERHVDALGEIANSLALASGRKQILLLSEGVPTKLLTGRDARDSKEEAEQAEAIIRGTWMTKDAVMGDSDSDQRFGASSTLTLLQRMERYFRRSDVVLHAVDLQGARVQQDTFSGFKVNSNNGLATLARVTGGTMFENANNIGDDFRRLLHQQEVVYILGFQAPTVKPGTFHELNVKVSGVRRAHVDARSGYYEGTTSYASRTASDAEIVVNDIGQSGIHMASFAAPVSAENGLARVPVILEIDGRDLADATMLDAAANIAVYAFDESGTVRDRIYQTMTFDRAKLDDRLRAGGVKYYGTLALPPGNYAIKTLIRIARSDRRGYARTDIHVPQAGEFGLVPFIVDEEPGNWVMVKGPSREGQAVYPFQINGQALVPAVMPRLHAGQSPRLALFIQNAEPEQLSLEVTPNATVIESVKANGGTKFVLQASQLREGVHSVDVVVRKSGENALRARIPLVVE